MIERLLISVMLMLTWMGTAKAEGEGQTQTLTVFDSDISNPYVPVWGDYAHRYQKCEMIYPAENLNTMAFTSISRMDFYTSENRAKTVWNAPFKVYLREVGQSAFPSENPTYIGFSEDDLVYEGPLDAMGEVMSIVFNKKKSYYYQGGNLLVGIYITEQGGNYSIAYFLGKEMSNACIYGKSSNSLDEVTPNKSHDKKFKNFLPKTTFHFTKIEQPVPSAPVAITTSDITHNSATIGWTSSASLWQICVNNDEENLINASTNPYTLTGLATDQSYEVKIRAVNGTQVSKWSNTVSIRTLSCSPDQMVNISYELQDERGDGWQGSAIVVKDALTDEELDFWTIEKEEETFSGSLSVCLERDIYFDFVWIPNTSTYDCHFVVYDPNGEILFEGNHDQKEPIYYTVSKGAPRPTSLTVSNIEVNSVAVGWNEKGDATKWQLCVDNDMENLILAESNPFTLTGLVYDTPYTVMVRAYIDDDNVSNWSEPISFTTAEICPKPTNLLCEPGSTDAMLSWDGALDSYVLQYNAWWKQGEDVTAVDSHLTYTYDLSYFSGKGSIAIRHYNVSNKFWLHIDDIVVTNAEGTIVYSEDFENCGGKMPAKIFTINNDDDDYGWEVRKDSKPDGYTGDDVWIFHGWYGISSASYRTEVHKELEPDDWLIISDVELGGTLSFMGYSQTYNDDNFAVYVMADAYMREVPISNSTSYHATRLVNDVPYTWRIKGVRGTDESRWASSLFVTPYDPHAIATGISEVQQATSDAWFTIDGQKLSDKPTKKGVYIQNGKKTILN